MNFDDIVKKHGYVGDLKSFLKQVYDEFVLYYGSDQESIIYEAFLNCPLVNENCYTALKSRGFLDNILGDSLVSESDLKRASGVYSSHPTLVYDENTGKYQITDIKRIVVISNLDLKLEYVRSAIIHELSHLVKSYYNEFSVDDNNILIEKSGLLERKYQLTGREKAINMHLIEERATGLEEGFTSLAEEEISKKIINPDYKVSGYGTVTLVAKQLSQIPDALIKMKMAEIYKDKSELYETFGDDYYKLEEVVDKMYEYSLAQFASLFDRKKMQTITDEFNAYIDKEYIPLMKKIKDNSRKMG